MLPKFFRSITYAVITSLLVTTIPLPVRSAWASDTSCVNAYEADAGTNPDCAAVRLTSGERVAFPKLAWTRISDAPVAAQSTGSGALAPSPEATALANRSALALGISSDELATAIQMFPSNVPFVFARYNPLDLTLRIDVFRLDKARVGSSSRAGLYHAVFTPSHGNFWRASKAYIHPDARVAGTTAGLNPFSAFTCPGRDSFCNISLNGAQVALGHAQRYIGAPMSLLAVADSRMDQKVTKSGNAFRKKVRTVVTGIVKPSWMIGYPAQFQSRSTSMPMATFCASDPRATSCPMYQVASAGVVFEDFEGGTLSDIEDKFVLYDQTKSSLGFLAVLVLAVVLSFTIVGALGAAGMIPAAAGGIAGTTGIFGSLLVTQGITLVGMAAVAVEAAIVGSLLMLGGANLNSALMFRPGAVLGVSNTNKGFIDKPKLEDLQQKLSNIITPMVEGNFNNGASGSALTGFGTTVYGNCAPGSLLSNCGGSTGIVPRADQYIEQNQVQFLRDNGGSIIRNDSPVGPDHL